VALATLMSAADAFVLTVEQGAVGAIERTGGPFLDWLRTSAMLLPLFVLAVLVALSVARRSAGRVRPSRAVLVAGALVVIAGTFVGTAAVAVSAAYDYHLQSAQLQSTAALHGSIHGPAHAASVSIAQAESLRMDALGARNAGRLVLAANLVIVGWVTALRGGRLEATNVRRWPVP
jgi:hypothetical protein